MRGEQDTAELQAICEVCVLPIDDGEGAVWVQPPSPGSRRDIDEPETLQDLLRSRAERAAWHVTHDECGRAQVGYRIEVERIRTWAAYLHWTGHLMGKDWIADTNWSDLIMDSLDPTSTSSGGIRPLALRDPGHRNVGD
jgi:hypothetical protein